MLQEEIRPETAPFIEPADKQEEVKKTNPLRLVTKIGEVVELPPRPLLSMSNDEKVLEVGKQIVSNEANAISKSLALVMSEIHAIDQEPDDAKRSQMQNNLGVQLDIEKDDLISYHMFEQTKS